MHEPERRLVPTSLVRLERRLAGSGRAAIPFVVVRLPQLEQTAWRAGRRTALRLERRAASAFAEAASRVLRSGDRIAHDPGHDVFVAALIAPTREVAHVPAAVDPRSALARIAAMMESRTQLDVQTGWTTYHCGREPSGLAVVADRALARGAAERERYGFFSALGHELRTPLASIRGYLETVLDGDLDEPHRRRFLAIAHNESIRMSRLVDGMFEISLLDLHATAGGRTQSLLERSIVAACDACASSAAARGVTLSTIPMPASPVIAMDGDRMTLVLVNVIENAIKHGRPGGTVTIAAVALGTGFVRLTVDDDGPGIPAADRDRLFAVGVRGATEAPGSGIGLALVRLILERAGGRIHAGEAPQGGARLEIVVPRAAEGMA